MRGVTKPTEQDPDLDPAEELDIEGGEMLPANPNAQIALQIPVTHEQVVGLERMAQERGIVIHDAVSELIDEGLSARRR
jgi:hypothetical protein